MTSREKFEQAIKARFGDSIDYRVCKNSDGEYMAWDMQVAWWAWQAAETDMAVQLANAESKCRELAEFKSRVYAQMGAGCEAPEFAITEGLNNLRRLADTLHAIEREFFTKEVPDEECEGETVEECPLCWGMTVEQYVSEFGKCLAEVRASAIKSALTDCSEYLDRDCIMESNGISYDDAALREIGAMALQEELLRKGAAL